MAYHETLQHFSDQSTAVFRPVRPENLASSSDNTPKEQRDFRRLLIETAGKQPAHGGAGGPTWLSSGILHLQTTNSDSSPNSAASNHHQSLHRSTAAGMSPNSANFASYESNQRRRQAGNSGGGGELGESEGGGGGGLARCKAEILAHPLCEQLLSAHVSCLRIATPVDQLPRIDAQLEQSQQFFSKYSAIRRNSQPLIGDDHSNELDQFMTHFVLLLCSFKDRLQQHVRVHATEAVMACWEIEQSLQSLTGVSPGEGTGATMSDDDDDDDDLRDIEASLHDGSLEGPEGMGFGPLIPTESEKSLLERVRLELKHELKQGYKGKITDIRDEILRKRRAGKLPGDTTSLLKAWWQSHSKWPYPTEEDKARLVQETGLQLKQINNWFINQRKRNWHNNSSSSSSLKSKRKRAAIVIG